MAHRLESRAGSSPDSLRNPDPTAERIGLRNYCKTSSPGRTSQPRLLSPLSSSGMARSFTASVSTSLAIGMRHKTRHRRSSSYWPGRPDRSASQNHSARGCTALPSAWHEHARSEAARRRAAERRKAEINRQQDHAECGPEPMDYDELHEEIDRLPEKYRLPIILCYMQGRTQPQAAQMLGWPLGTVQIRLHRGRERLRSRLSRAGTGLIALTGSDLTKSLSVPTAVLDREWTETTARAAVRFAAGKATAGLVAPPVAGLASRCSRPCSSTR